jgi:predicted MPP superfamily phosphohydrolase
LRVLDGMAGDGADLILAGHTHGGQVCWPGGRAIVTNCDIDPARAKGLSRHRAGQQGADEQAAGSYLHVSQGLGTAPSAPIRLFCPPRATILTLVPRA